MSADVYDLPITAPGRNAMSTDLMQRLLAALREAGGRPLLLRGSEGAFSAGLNLKEVAGLERDGMRRFLLLLDELTEALWEYPGPTVACVDGHAIAGGCVLALCCDWRVARDDAALRIGLNEVALGLEFPPRILALARERVPRRHLEFVLLEAGLHAPRAALALGLVDEVALDAQAAARAALERLSEPPRAAYVATKLALRRGVLALDETRRRHFEEHIVPAWCAEDTKARIRARLR